jgi:ketosteroid isomerase-like protein
MSGAIIAEAENRWARAMMTRHISVLNALLHPGFLFVGPRSAGLNGWNKAEWIAAVSKIEFVSLTHPIRDLQLIGSTAVVTVEGDWQARVNGQAVTEQFMMTDVWVRDQGGVWRVMRRHSSRYVVSNDGAVSEASQLFIDGTAA